MYFYFGTGDDWDNIRSDIINDLIDEFNTNKYNRYYLGIF